MKLPTSPSAMHPSWRQTCLLALSMVTAAPVLASENGLQRYAPGAGGSDMATPLVPGWYWQTAAVQYQSTKLKGNNGDTLNPAMPAQGLPANVAIIHWDISTAVVLNRLLYLSTERVMGANVGFTVVQPMGMRKAHFSASPTTPAYTAAASALSSNLSANDGKVTSLGDLELAPILHWEIGDHQAATLVPTMVLPTGDYDATRQVNLGYGNFFTFRPSLQYAYMGDGWDVGGRAVLSFNTRNKDNGYYSGHMFNIDWQAMKFVTEDVRMGLQGFWVRQLSRDTCQAGIGTAVAQCSNNPFSLAAVATGNKSSVTGFGPAVAWLKGGGDFLLEGKYLKDYNAKNRPEGRSIWLTLSKPL